MFGLFVCLSAPLIMSQIPVGNIFTCMHVVVVKLFFFKMLFGILFHYSGILFPKALINTFGAVSTFLSPQKSPEESSPRETW